MLKRIRPFHFLIAVFACIGIPVLLILTKSLFPAEVQPFLWIGWGLLMIVLAPARSRWLKSNNME